MSVKTISQALHESLRNEMLRDSKVFTMGEECGFDGLYGVSTDLEKEFGTKRVIATPISEAGFVGMAVGAAMRGMRPVAELMYIDFIGVCMDQIINQAAKMCYMTGGQISVPMVLRLPMGSRAPQRRAAFPESGVSAHPYSRAESDCSHYAV